VDGLTSDKVLAHLRPGLLKLGYEVEGGKHRTEKIRRPVLFGDQGRERVAYEIDAVHDELGILVEVEAGRGARGNAVYRDLVRSSLIVDQRFLVLGVMRSYRHQSSGRPIIVSSYRTPRTSWTRCTQADGCGCPSRACCYSAIDPLYHTGPCLP